MKALYSLRRLSLCIAVGLFATVIDGCDQVDKPLPQHATADTGPVAAPGSRAAATPLPDFSALVDKYGPAVVNVSVTGTVKNSGQRPAPDMGPDDPFWQFFRRFQGQMPPRDVPVRGLASGIIISPMA